MARDVKKAFWGREQHAPRPLDRESEEQQPVPLHVVALRRPCPPSERGERAIRSSVERALLHACTMASAVRSESSCH